MNATAPSTQSSLRKIGGLVEQSGCIRISGNYFDGRWRVRMTFHDRPRGIFTTEGSGQFLQEAYREAIERAKGSILSPVTVRTNGARPS